MSKVKPGDKKGDTLQGDQKPVGVSVLFGCADSTDYMLMALGTVGAIGDGMALPALLLFVSHLFNSLGDPSSALMHKVDQVTSSIVYLAAGLLVAAFLEGYCWSKTSERQVLKMRYLYLEAILSQEVAFFDSQEATTSEIVDSISKDTSLIQEVLGEKVPLFLMNTSQFFSGLSFATYFSWRLSLVAFPSLILLALPGIIYGKYLMRLSVKSFTEYSKANTIAEQALSSIKTVYAATAEDNIVKRYKSYLSNTTKLGLRKGLAKGFAVGSSGLTYAIWALVAWYGSQLVVHKGAHGGQIYAAGLSIVTAGQSLGVAFPEVKHLAEASIAAAHIFDRINRVPVIDGQDTEGIVLENIRGEVEFENVRFIYPSRPDSVVLNNFNLRIEAGKTVALVGSSGSGKSTAIALLQRFYDVNGGVVRVDGVGIKGLQLKWLRAQMGLVSQDHALFGTSIKENIKFGKLNASLDEVMNAAKAANAHDFITQLPEGYDSKVGERGALLSGGQKQRISIARAIIKNPVILLLDEATSALDSESEAIVQNSLEQASLGRTTLIVAHKLSTVRNADVIAVMSAGRVIEMGSHDDLIKKENGHYANLANLQNQLSSEGQDQHYNESRVSSAARSSASRISTGRSSPSVFGTPLPGDLDPNAISYPPPSFTRLLGLNSPEWKQGLIGALSAMACGAITPIYALTIGGMIYAFFLPRDQMQDKIRNDCFIFSSLALIAMFMSPVQHYHFAYMGEQLTKRVRGKMLEKVLTFEPAWFDEEQNSSGALCGRLSNEAALVKSLVADRVSLLIQTISAVVLAVILGLVVAWKLAIVMIAVQPLTILCFYGRKVVLSSVGTKFVRAQNLSTQIAIEAVYNHRIVTSFGSVPKVLELFDEAQNEPRKEGDKKAWLAGIGIGSAQCITFLCWALDFWYGGRLVSRGEITGAQVFKTFFILVSTGKVIGEAGSMTSDLAKGSTAVASVFAILDRRSLISNAESGIKLQKMFGGIEFKGVDFAYPGRPERLVLCQLRLEVKPGASIGLVGNSGCGKSTLISLIERFYDPEKGTVKVDGVDIRSLDIGWYRRQMALVSQEPVLFSGSIRDNIVFGKLDASEDEIVEAAKAANAHEFISALQEGYNTECGERGVQLSGGQKQRIAIARAIIRKPTILLLDEATSALDVHSEQVVQEALDRIMVGRTTMVVAHRLNTIKNLDSIAFLANGKVLERGTFAQLMSKRGAFYKLSTLHDT